jgi:hypothetical protein
MEHIRGCIYFVQPTDGGLIKIGQTRNSPQKRLAELQIGCPVPLELLGVLPGTIEHERSLHRRFADLRQHNEWFEPGERLLYFIRRWAIPPGDWGNLEPVYVISVDEHIDGLTRRRRQGETGILGGLFRPEGKVYGIVRRSRVG